MVNSFNKRESIILRIRNYYPSFTKKEKKVADVVLEKAHEIVYLSITEFAEVCNVSETTVVRLCFRLKISGYQEFKLLLAQDTVLPEENLHEKLELEDDISVLAKKVTNENIQAINNTMRIFSPQELKKAVDVLINANHIEIYGVGASGYSALAAGFELKRLGLYVNAYIDPHIQAMSASLLTEKDAVIGISHTGSTRDTIDSLKVAKKAGASIICITNHSKSPITRYADIMLLTSVVETPLRSGALTSRMAQLHVIDLLHTSIALQIKEKAFQNINKTAEAVLNKLY